MNKVCINGLEIYLVLSSLLLMILKNRINDGMILAVRLSATFMSSGKFEYIVSGTGMTLSCSTFCNLMGIRYFYIPSCPAFSKNSLFILVAYTLVSPFILAVLILPCKGKTYGRIPSTVFTISYLILPAAFHKSKIWVFQQNHYCLLGLPSFHAFVFGMKIHSRQ